MTTKAEKRGGGRKAIVDILLNPQNEDHQHGHEPGGHYIEYCGRYREQILGRWQRALSLQDEQDYYWNLSSI